MGISSELKDSQFLNVELPPISVTESGINSDLSDLQPSKANDSIFVTVLGISIDSKFTQPENAPCPIVVTLSGMVYALCGLPAGYATIVFLSLLKIIPFSE